MDFFLPPCLYFFFLSCFFYFDFSFHLFSPPAEDSSSVGALILRLNGFCIEKW